MATHTNSKNSASAVTDDVKAEVVSVEDTVSNEPVVFKGLTNNQMAAISTFEEAMRIATLAHGEAVTADDFTQISDKDELLGKRFVIMQFEMGKNLKFGTRPFVIVKAMTVDGVKIVFTDGSTGIMEQLQVHANEGRYGNVICKRGLRKSEYWVDEKGQKTTADDPDKQLATTYYLN